MLPPSFWFVKPRWWQRSTLAFVAFSLVVLSVQPVRAVFWADGESAVIDKLFKLQMWSGQSNHLTAQVPLILHMSDCFIWWDWTARLQISKFASCRVQLISFLNCFPQQTYIQQRDDCFPNHSLRDDRNPCPYSGECFCCSGPVWVRGLHWSNAFENFFFSLCGKLNKCNSFSSQNFSLDGPQRVAIFTASCVETCRTPFIPSHCRVVHRNVASQKSDVKDLLQEVIFHLESESRGTTIAAAHKSWKQFFLSSGLETLCGTISFWSGIHTFVASLQTHFAMSERLQALISRFNLFLRWMLNEEFLFSPGQIEPDWQHSLTWTHVIG